MKKIRKNKFFKLTSWLLIPLFIFQADYLLAISQEGKSDVELQYELAKREFVQGNYNAAEARLERLILVLNKKIKKEKRLLDQARVLLGIIRKSSSGVIMKVSDKKNDKKKKKFPWLLVVGGVVVVGVLVYFLALRPKKYTLTVTKGEGIEGYPESGTYTYKKGTTVNYNYTSQQGYIDLIVTLGSEELPGSGTITMDRDHTLIASTTRLVSVHIESNFSGAELYVDSQIQGLSTPCDFIIIPGSHELKLIKNNFGEAKRSITFEENLNYNIQVTLSGYTYELVTKWGSLGSDQGQFSEPAGITVDENNYIYVADNENHRIQKFDSNGVFVKLRRLSDENPIYDPYDIAIDKNNYIYVTSGGGYIQLFDPDGRYETRWGFVPNGISKFSGPIGIAIDKNHYVYIVDSGNNQIKKYKNNGVSVTQWGEKGNADGQFDSPAGIAIDGNNNIYVTDSFNTRIQKFDSNGTFISKWGTYDKDKAQFYWPFGIAVDERNFVYVSEYDNDFIHKFDPNGNFITKWESGGDNNSQFLRPNGIAVDKEGYVYKADPYRHRIQKFRMTDQTGDDGEWTINSTPTASSKLSTTPSFTEKKNPDKKKQSQNFKTWKER